jgi:adhesin HecA-like repeat protein
MKKIYAALAAICTLSYPVLSQCSSCTTTISSSDANTHIVSAGTTLCISPSVTVSGTIIVSGGTLCNQGTIHNQSLIITGSGSTLNNYGTIISDSLLVFKTGSVLNNYGYMTDSSITVSAGALFNNNSGTITCSTLADSAGTFVNNGNVTVNQDLGTGYGGQFTNNNYLKIGHDFLNGAGATFTTSCMVSVANNWFNSASINGPLNGCGGFSIAGGSVQNSGTVGAVGHVDLCAVHTISNIGTMTGVTNCVCTNACSMITTGIRELKAPALGVIKNLYPNPADREVNLLLNLGNTMNILVTVTDILGKTTLSRNYGSMQGEDLLNIDVSALPPGIYLITVSNEKGDREQQKFNIVRH